jgi:hypothetical protein
MSYMIMQMNADGLVLLSSSIGVLVFIHKVAAVFGMQIDAA